MADTKFCKNCREEKSLTEFYRHNETADGLFSICKSCFSIKQTEKAEKNRKKWTQQDPYATHKTGTKRCIGCKQTMSIYCFSTDVIRGDGLRPICKECRRKASRDWQNKNKDAVRRYIKDYQARNKEVIAQRTKKYRQDHPDRYAATNAVWSAILTGKLPKASEHPCANPKCTNHANQYHHASYEPEHWLDVIPLCVSCHVKVGAKTLHIP